MIILFCAFRLQKIDTNLNSTKLHLLLQFLKRMNSDDTNCILYHNTNLETGWILPLQDSSLWPTPFHNHIDVFNLLLLANLKSRFNAMSLVWAIYLLKPGSLLTTCPSAFKPAKYFTHTNLSVPYRVHANNITVLSKSTKEWHSKNTFFALF